MARFLEISGPRCGRIFVVFWVFRFSSLGTDFGLNQSTRPGRAFGRLGGRFAAHSGCSDGGVGVFILRWPSLQARRAETMVGGLPRVCKSPTAQAIHSQRRVGVRLGRGLGAQSWLSLTFMVCMLVGFSVDFGFSDFSGLLVH